MNVSLSDFSRLYRRILISETFIFWFKNWNYRGEFIPRLHEYHARSWLKLPKGGVLTAEARNTTSCRKVRSSKFWRETLHGAGRAACTWGTLHSQSLPNLRCSEWLIVAAEFTAFSRVPIALPSLPLNGSHVQIGIFAKCSRSIIRQNINN